MLQSQGSFVIQEATNLNPTLGGIGQDPFQNSSNQIHLWTNSFEVTRVTQGINLALRLCASAEI